MTKYYLVDAEVAAALPQVELAQLERALQERLTGAKPGTAVIILAYFRTATKCEAPILLDQPLPDPPPPKRGRPPKRKEQPLERPVAGFPPRPASLIIESCLVSWQPDQDGLYRATVVGLDRGTAFQGNGLGETRQAAVWSALDLAKISEADIAASPDTGGKAALVEALK